MPKKRGYVRAKQSPQPCPPLLTFTGDASLVRVGRRGGTGVHHDRVQLCLCGRAQSVPDLPASHAVPGLSFRGLAEAQGRVVGAAADAAGRLVRWRGQDRRAVPHL